MTRIQTIRSRMTTRGAALGGAVVLMLSTGGALAYAGGGQEDDLGANGDGVFPSVSAEATPTASQDDDGPRVSTEPADDGPGQVVSDPRPNDQGAIGPQRAAEIALAHVGGGSVTEVEREEEHGRLEWKIEVLRSSQRLDVRVDAGTGTVTRVEADGRDDDGRDEDDHGRHHRSGNDDHHDDHSDDDSDDHSGDDGHGEDEDDDEDEDEDELDD